MMFGRGYGACFGYNGFGGFWHLMIFVGITLIILAIIFYATQRNHAVRAHESVLEALKMKFVQGEITEEEYLRRKNTLEK